jgi:predicted dehydrogenase
MPVQTAANGDDVSEEPVGSPLPAPLGVAVIGYAFMGKAHSAAWRNVAAYFDVPAVEQTVLVGRDAEKVAAAAARFGWKDSATDWRAVLLRDDVHIVDVCTPGILHHEIVLAALAAGKHVIVEKPLANTVTEADEMVQAFESARANGQHAIVNFNYRRVPAIALAKKLIDDGRVGPIRHVRVSYLQDWLSDSASPMSWRLRRDEAGSGALGDLGSHATDLVLHLTGENIDSLTGGVHTFVTQRPAGDSGDGAIGGSATGSSAGDSAGDSGDGGVDVELEDVTVDDAAWATGRLSGGGLLQLEVSRFALGAKNGLSLEIYGERGSLTFDLENLNELRFFDGDDAAGEQGFRRILVTEAGHPYVGHWWPDGHVIGWEHTFVHQFAEFLTSIRDDTESQPSFSDGLRVQKFLAAVERSAAEGGASITP